MRSALALDPDFWFPRQQPQFPTEIDGDNPITNGLSFAWQAANNTQYLLVGNGSISGNTFTAAKIDSCPYGLGLTNSVNSIGGYFGNGATGTNLYNVPTTGSLVAFVTAGGSPTDGRTRAVFDSGDGTVGNTPATNFALYKSSANTWVFGASNSTSATGTATGTFSAGDTFTVGGNWGASGTLFYLIGNNLYTNGSAISLGTTGNRGYFNIGAFANNANDTWCFNAANHDAIYYVLIWNRQLADWEFKELERAPWSWLRPAYAFDGVNRIPVTGGLQYNAILVHLSHLLTR